MSLSIGTQAPDFELPSTSGRNFKLSRDAEQKACIIYFYPKNFTSVCTKEACSFRDTFDFFKNLDIPVYGISRDTLASHHEFKEAHQLPFELLSDLHAEVARTYDALIPFVNMPKRITYLLDAEHKIAGCYENVFASQRHIDEMIRLIKKNLAT